MNRRAFLKAVASAALVPILPHHTWATTNFRRHRPSDRAWPSQFEAEATCIREAMRGLALRIEHVGSTAVPGLAAKPVIDLS